MSSSTRVHKSNDSYAFGTSTQPASIHNQSYLGGTTTPQQKIVQVLVNRMRNKLPCNSGVPLNQLEADSATQQAVEALVDLSPDSLDIIAWALSELLERLISQKDAHGQWSIEVLQSKLFILKVLSVAMATRWYMHQQEAARSGSQTGAYASSIPDSPLPSASSKRGRQASSEYSGSFSEPPPLDDNCAKYVLSVMVLFIRPGIDEDRLVPSSSLSPEATHSPGREGATGPALRTQVSTASFQSGNSGSSAIPLPMHQLAYEETPVTQVNATHSLHTLISQFAGRIVYHLSASNWRIVFSRLRHKIHFIANTSDDNPDVLDLSVMTHCAMDRSRLVQVLHELSSLLVNMKKETQLAVALPVRKAIWNWIDVFPGEFNEAIRSRGRMEGAPERVFDLLYMVQVGHEIKLWPTLVILNCITSERLSPDFQVNHFGYGSTGGQKNSHRKDSRFLEDMIKHSNSASKLADAGLICALDMCRAAAYVRAEGEVPLRIVAFDIAHEIKSALWKNHFQKPFWESHDDIDVAVYSEALVTVFRFLPEEDFVPLFTATLEPERSDAVKLCAVNAMVSLAQEATRLPSQKPLDKLYALYAQRLRDIVKINASTMKRVELDQYGNSKRRASRPRAKRFTSDHLDDRELLMMAILGLFRTDPAFIMYNFQERENEAWSMASIKLWDQAVDHAVKLSVSTTFKMLSEMSFARFPDEPNDPVMSFWLARGLHINLVGVVGNLIHTRTDLDSQRIWINTALDIIDLFVRPTDSDHLRAIQLAPARTPAFALAEIAFFICLTSADSGVSQLAARGLRKIASAERQHGAPPNPGHSNADLSKRNPVYDQLGDPNVPIVGRVGHQKRVRKLVRLIAHPSASHTAIWTECYWRWMALTEAIPQRTGSTYGHHAINHLSDEDLHAQWRNLTLFLAAFGGVCADTHTDRIPLTSIIPAAYLPDQMRTAADTSTFTATFIDLLGELLVHEDSKIRDVAREALGSELSPKLYSRLIKHLDEAISGVIQGGLPDESEMLWLFLDQFTYVLKMLVDTAPHVPVDEVLNIDVGATLQTLAGLLSRIEESQAWRIKTKFCNLCDSVSDRTDILTLRRDGCTRHNILDMVMEWIDEPSDPADPLFRDRTEMNLTCLRTAVKLLDRLQLRPLDGSVDDEHGHVVSRLFIRYSKLLLRGLDICGLDVLTSDSRSDLGSVQKRIHIGNRDSELRELVITGLTHLVSANSASGFKQCLPLAYDQDLRKRTIFAHVFARVLGQGTKFNVQDSSLSGARQSPLCELVKGSDMVLAMAICETCPTAEVDIMISVLMNLFDGRESLMSLLKMMIDREVAHTDSEASLFRGNSMCTRFLSAFAKLHGYTYLRGLIGPLLQVMASRPPGPGYELDPAKISENEDVVANQVNVEFVASSFLQIISDSIPALPPMFREICSHISKAVNEIWPEAKFAAMGAFLFLRFISPAVVAPEIVDVEVPSDPTTRRGLMVVAKIIQNLANNIFFGKEKHMTCLNAFLTDNIVNVTRFLSEVNKFSPASQDEDATEWPASTVDDTDTIVLHRFFEKHADKIGKELLSLSKPSPDGDSSAMSGKTAWDGLCAALVDLGPCSEVPKLSNMTSEEHPTYIDVMTRLAHRSTDSVRGVFTEVPANQDQHALFLVTMSKIDVEALDIELLMFHIFKTLAHPQYESRSFEIIMDCTSFTTSSELPVQWLKYCTEMIPQDIRQRFLMTYILNPNNLTQKYLRRIYNVSAGIPFSIGIKAYSCVEDLAKQLPEADLGLLEYASNLERESFETYERITMKHSLVQLAIGRTHLRITSNSALAISPQLSCRCTEIVSLADVSDVYNVSTGQDAHEFIIRRTRQPTILHFSSPSRDAIVKDIRTAKGAMRDSRGTVAERFSRFSNVPATLLHVAMLSIDLDDEDLRSAAYDLLGAVCSYLEYDKNPVVASRAGFIPGDHGAFVIQLSERLAEFQPQLTLDFISEVSTGMEKVGTTQRINCLQYISPWIKNLAHFPNPISPHYEQSGARLRDCIRQLSDMTITDPEISSTVLRCVWSEIGKLDSPVVNIVLDELIRAAIDGGIGSRRSETVARIVATLSSVNVRGRLFSKLRRALGKISMKPSKTLIENAHWSEIAALTRLALIAVNQSKPLGYYQLYVPEMFHVCAILAGIGETLVRKSVYGMIVNLLQSMYLARTDETSGARIMALIEETVEPDTLLLFGLMRGTPTSEYKDCNSSNDNVRIERQERLTELLQKIMEVTAGSAGLLNVWRARWMSLVTSTAFQLSPAIQSRAFVVLGTLATSDVDDDLLYQMLVAFKTALSQCSDSDTSAVVSMLRCICKVVPSLQGTSRYISQVFWLAVALLQSSHVMFYCEASNLLRAILENMDEHEAFKDSSVPTILLDSRSALEEIACQADQLLGLAFDSSFSFSLASIIFKGVRHSGLRDASESVLRTLLQVTARTSELGTYVGGIGEALCPDALGYFVALLPLSASPQGYQRLLEDSNLELAWLDRARDDEGVPRVSLDMLGVTDQGTALLLTSFIGAILTSAQGDDAETEILYTLLSDVAEVFPEIVSMTYDGLQDRIKDIFAVSSSPSIIKAVSNVFRVSLLDASRTTHNSRGMDDEASSIHGPGRNHLAALEDMGMQGIATSFQFVQPGRGLTKMLNLWIPELIAKIIE